MVRVLPEPEHCASAPEDARYGQIGVLELDQSSVEVATLVTIGDIAGAWPALDAYAARAVELRSLYHHANAVYWRGMLLARNGDHERAFLTLRGAAEEALVIEARPLLISALLGSIEVSTAMGELGQAQMAASIARGLIEPGEGQWLADLARLEGSALMLGDDASRKAGIEQLRASVRMEEEALVRHGGSHERLSFALEALALGLLVEGENYDAIRALDRSIELHEREFGPLNARAPRIRLNRIRALIANAQFERGFEEWLDVRATLRRRHAASSDTIVGATLQVATWFSQTNERDYVARVLGPLRRTREINDVDLDSPAGEHQPRSPEEANH
ncbi:MAG: hypothetical protein HC927_08145 [Deltaproteobacteria bacterium]|nr:hypothetical protein [Deltaproteobacteria bacterium]